MTFREKFLTTGQAAKRCSVTPDTILKWIRSGFLPARRTAGGHHRIDVLDLERVAGPLPHEQAAGETAFREKQHMYCWEYNGDGVLPNSCKECAVYRMRAHRCYEVMNLAPEAGHPKTFCKNSCSECDYYLTVHEQAMNVLIVCDDKELTKALERQAALHDINLEITDCEYTCSSAVSRFRPDFAIVDCHLGPKASSDLCYHLSQDPRIPFVRIVIAANEEDMPSICNKEIFARIQRPFNIQDILECIKGAASKLS